MDLEKKNRVGRKKATPFTFYAFHGRSENELSHKFRHKSVGNSLEIWTRPNENHSNSQEESNDELKMIWLLWSEKRNGVCWVPHIIEPDKSFSQFFAHGRKIRRNSGGKVRKLKVPVHAKPGNRARPRNSRSEKVDSRAFFHHPSCLWLPVPRR